MKNNVLVTLLLFFSLNSFSQNYKVSVEKNEQGMKLVVDGNDFMINGMNWDYVPIGKNYSYSLWKQPDALIKQALDAEMSLLRNLGVNTIRVYTGIQAKWITYIYETYGIYTMLNHTFGRYGLTINGVWIPITDYSDDKTKKLLLSEVTKIANDYKNTPGLLLYLLGNENNYGLFWAGAETEDFPEEEEKIKFIGEARGRSMYKLMNAAALEMKSINSNLPVAICNGDLLFLEIVAQECKDVDIYGTNMYRGKSFADAFERVKKELNMPILFTEFGSDAFNAVSNKEDQKMQAFFMVENWKEIYQNASGLGKAENAIGGFTFQFSDGWWKYGQTKNLDVHDNNASWSNGGYYLDLEGKNNNMNEEWFGICAKGPTNSKGLYTLYPRAAYYNLKEAHSINPLEKGITAEAVAEHFSNINLMDGVLRARGDLVWEDDFSTDGTLDDTKWAYNIGTGENGWGNNELQYYRSENVKLEGGMLHITARKESFQGAGYTSGRILTKGLYEQKYGRIEARIKLPYGKGYWPAFWMLGANLDENVGGVPDSDPNTDIWPLAGEIDIMEYLGSAPTSILGSVHGPGYSAGEAVSKSHTLMNDRFDTDFHVFGIEWGENYINYYVDNVLYNQITPADVSGQWVFNKPFFIILNMAIGGNLPGSPNAETIFPQTMLVDYVKVYQ